MSKDFGLLPDFFYIPNVMEGMRDAQPWFGWLMLALALPVQFYVGAQYYRGGYKAVRNGSANMDVLIAMGSSAAYSDLIHKLGGPAMNGLYAAMTTQNPYLDEASQPIRFWANKYKTKFNEDPTVFSAYGYTIIDSFATAAGKAGQTLTTDTFIKAIKMIIAPIIFCTVVHGIASMQDMKKVGRVGLKALIYFEVLTTESKFGDLTQRYDPASVNRTAIWSSPAWISVRRWDASALQRKTRVLAFTGSPRQFGFALAHTARSIGSSPLSRPYTTPNIVGSSITRSSTLVMCVRRS